MYDLVVTSAETGSPHGEPPKVFLHIGPPKTGTTFIQTTLRYWHRELRSGGVTVPGGASFDHFLAALDARGDHTFGFGVGGDVKHWRARGAWTRLASTVVRLRGTVVITHELFSTADAQHAKAAIAALGG